MSQSNGNNQELAVPENIQAEIGEAVFTIQIPSRVATQTSNAWEQQMYGVMHAILANANAHTVSERSCT